MADEITYCCLFPNKHHSYSDVFSSREKTVYQIGRPDGSPMKLFNVSHDEAVSIVTHLPEELLQAVKEHYGLGEVTVFNPYEHLKDDELAAVLSVKELQEVSVVPNEVLTQEADKVTETTTQEPAEDTSEEDHGVDFDKNLAEMNVTQLRVLCKQLGISGYSKLEKKDLVEAIEKVLEESDDTD